MEALKWEQVVIKMQVLLIGEVLICLAEKNNILSIDNFIFLSLKFDVPEVIYGIIVRLFLCQ